MWAHGDPVDPESLERLTRFAEKIATAQAQWESSQVLAIHDAADAVNAKTGLKDWRANAWLLNNSPRSRERWRPHREVNVTQSGTVQHEHSLVSALSTNELESVIEELKALPDPSSISPHNG